MPHDTPRRGLRPDGTPAMTPAEFRATRILLGFSVPRIAEVVKVDERSVRKWEAGDNPVPEGIAKTLDKMCKDTALFVDKVVSKRRLDPEWQFRVPVSRVGVSNRRLDASWGGWPMEWWWGIAGRALDANRRTRGGFVVYGEDAEGPSMRAPVIPESPRPPRANEPRTER